MRHAGLLLVLGLGSMLALAAGCTTTVVREVSGGDNPGAGDDGTTGDDGGAAAKKDGGANGNGGGGGGGTTPAEPTHLATDMTIAQVTVNQAVMVTIAKQGAKASHTIPVVANRDALVRVYVTPSSGYKARALTAVLSLTDKSGKALPQLTDTETLKAASTDATLGSTFNFYVPASSLPQGVKYSVAVTDSAAPEVAAGTASQARYPADGSSENIGAESDGPQVKVVVVPVQYMADGSGRLPDTSATQLDTYKKTMQALYPVASVSMSVRAPYQWSKPISANGTGFSTVLQAIVNLRQQDNAPADVYYFAAFAPSASFTSYCGGGCVTGLSGVMDQPTDSFGRASVGIGYTGDAAATTMAHEVGHAHGRNHAPCGGTNGVDPSFPDSTGGIGQWGFDMRSKTLISPSSGKDIMGYCQPEWISGYTYSALFDRIAAVNGVTPSTTMPLGPKPGSTELAALKSYRFVDVAEDGTLSWGEPVSLREEPVADPRPVTFEGSDGAPVATAIAHYYKYDHLPGGFLVVPDGGASFTNLAVHLSTTSVARLAK